MEEKAAFYVVCTLIHGGLTRVLFNSHPFIGWPGHFSAGLSGLS